MKKREEFLSYANDCVRISRSLTDPHDGAALLGMAMRWAELADYIPAPVTAQMSIEEQER